MPSLRNPDGWMETPMQTGATPQQLPLSPKWKRVLLCSLHPASSNYAHSC